MSSCTESWKAKRSELGRCTRFAEATSSAEKGPSKTVAILITRCASAPIISIWEMIVPTIPVCTQSAMPTVFKSTSSSTRPPTTRIFRSSSNCCSASRIFRGLFRAMFDKKVRNVSGTASEGRSAVPTPSTRPVNMCASVSLNPAMFTGSCAILLPPRSPWTEGSGSILVETTLCINGSASCATEAPWVLRRLLPRRRNGSRSSPSKANSRLSTMRRAFPDGCAEQTC
mmetsp:Transcript_5829/g.16884  ORF Transcript_5829/g.16884 Transcript_5829/m.16884 type:complete len:228 (+) Transcript_5829:354-1037(+)